MVREATFREDLFYRLNVVPIQIPPLRKRPGDIIDLSDHFLMLFSSELNHPPKTMTKGCYTLLEGYAFPGNVRELKNLIERLYILVNNDQICKEDIITYLPETEFDTGTGIQTSVSSFKEARAEFERQFLKEQLGKMDWHISSAAKILGMQQSNLSRKIKDLGLKK